jgi:predicted enzyme related to lactoylglutathione lyase
VFTKLMVMVFVSDMDRSVRFYRDVLGLSLEMETPYWSMVRFGDVQIGLHPQTPVNPANPAGMSIGFYVDDIDATVATLRGRGANVYGEKQEDFGKIATATDPDGYRIEICETPKGDWSGG